MVRPADVGLYESVAFRAASIWVIVKLGTRSHPGSYRRSMTDTDGSAISRLLDESRRGLDRVEPADLASVQAAGALVVDIRPLEQRLRDGALPGAVVIDRNVLEWRLDPSSPHRISEADRLNRRVVIVCNEGYGSSLAAHTLQRLGLVNATDLRGGYQAWMVWKALSPESGA